MKLSPAQVERTVNQLQIEAIPDNHPLVPQLNRLFGEHTYSASSSPLTTRSAFHRRKRAGLGVVVNVANWTNANPPKLEAHEPQPTESLVALETDSG